jgi:membrane-associated phospholipid phosphatase
VLAAALHRSAADLHAAGLALLEGFALVVGLKRWANLVGRLRPDFDARVALGDASQISDGRQSYPSGHAAYSFMALGLTSLYLLGRSRVLAAPPPGAFLVFVACFAPTAAAGYIALSRPANYKHDFSDINAGACIGLFSAAAAYLLNFGSPLDAAACGAPRLRGFTGKVGGAAAVAAAEQPAATRNPLAITPGSAEA